MVKLKFTKHINDSSSKFDLMIAAKVKELIYFFAIDHLAVFEKEMNDFIISFPKKNAYSLDNAYKVKSIGNRVEIWKHFAGSDKEPVLAYTVEENH